MKTKYVKVGQEGGYWLLTEGACSVKIYSSKQEKNGEVYETHSVYHVEAGKRVRKGFGDLTAAKNWGQTVLTRLINGDTESKGMSPIDLQDMALAKLELAGFDVSITTAVKEYRQAMEKLNGKCTVNDAVSYFLKNANPDLPAKTVAEVTKEMCEAKKKDGLSEQYQNDLSQRLGRFAKSFPGEITAIRTKDIEQWLRGLNTGPQTRNNYATAITIFFNFAKRCGYLAEDRMTAAENLTRAKTPGGEILVYTPEELTTMLVRLSDFKPELLPIVAIGAFAGIRTAELLRLTWDNIDFEQGLIEVGAKQSKTAKRRHIPIQPNLAAWLKPYEGKTGLIYGEKKIQLAIRRITEPTEFPSTGQPKPGVKWKQNALRHSYGSYRLPILKNAAELALEMGNSPAMIFRHYRELVKPAEAVKFWAIMPPVDYAEKMAGALAKVEAADAKKKAKVAA